MKRLVTVLFIICMQQAVFSQQSSNEKFKSHFDFMLGANVGIPFPEMKKAIQNNMGDAGFGLSLLLLSNPGSWGKKAADKKSFPLHIGGEIGYTYYGRFKTDVTVNGFSGDYKTSYGILKLNGVLRLRPGYNHTFTPFADIFAGGNFYLSTIKENLDFIETSLGIQPLDLGGTSSASFCKGIAVGFTIGPAAEDKARFVFRISYNDGNSIRYIVRNSLQYDAFSNRLVYQEGTAKLRYIMIELGIGI